MVVHVCKILLIIIGKVKLGLCTHITSGMIINNNDDTIRYLYLYNDNLFLLFLHILNLNNQWLLFNPIFKSENDRVKLQINRPKIF